MKYLMTVFLLLLSGNAMATTPTDKQIDNIQNSTGGSLIAVPSTGTTLATDTNTITLTNKTISGSSNTLSNIPVSALSTGTAITVNTGGTGDTTLTTNGMLFGNGTSAVGITSAGSQYQTFQAGASGVPTVGALQLNQAAAVSGQLPVASGGTGLSTLTANNVIIGNGSSSPTFVAPGTSGNILTSNGTTWSSAALGVGAPALNGSVASPQSVTAAGGISLSGLTYANVVFVKSNSGSVTVTATPSITACTAAGQTLTIVSEDGTNVIKLQNNADLAGSRLLLNGPWTSGLNNSSPYILNLICDGAGTPSWVEVSRNN